MEILQQITPPMGWQFVWPPAVGLLTFLFGLGIRGILFARLQRRAERTQWAWGDVAVQMIRGPFVLWCLIAAIYVAVIASSATADLERMAGRILSVLWLLSVTLALVKLDDALIQRYGKRLASALPLTSLTRNLARWMILVIGMLMILNTLGVSITPILTALGIGGLAVALALQDTLSNLFSGIYVTVARQIRVGDYVKLDSGEEGYVADISWRSTRLRSLPNNWTVIPNTKMAQSVVTNYDLPTPDLAVLVEVGVDYRSDLEDVERITSEVGKEVMKAVPGGVPDFDPFIRYHTFGDFSIQFTAILRARAFVDQYLVKHEFVKRLHRRYVQEGIAIPFPIRAWINEPSVAVKPPHR